MTEDQQQPDTFPGFWQAVGLHFELLLPILALVFVVLLVEKMADDVHLLEHPGTMALVALVQLKWLLYRESIRRACPSDEIAGPWVSRYLWLIPALALVKGFWLVFAPALAWVEQTWPVLKADRDFGMQTSPAGAAIWIVLAAPLFEEFLYRGVILRGFVARYGAQKAVALSALLFMAVHFYPILYVQTFAMGWLLGWIWLRTRSIWPGFLLHVANNLVAFISTVSGAHLLDETGFGPAGVAGGLALVVAGVFGLRRWAPLAVADPQ